jgi:hypothetical protein
VHIQVRNVDRLAASSAAYPAVIESRNNIRVSPETRAQLEAHRDRLSRLATIPAFEQATTRPDNMPTLTPAPAARRSIVPYAIAGTALAIASAVAVVLMTRG